MSSIFESSSGIAIHQDNSENAANARRTKKDEMVGKPPANKRAALGTITNLSTKSQLPRAAKQGTDPFLPTGSENVQPKGSKSVFSGLQQFSIHVDEPTLVHTNASNHGRQVEKTRKLLLHPEVTSLRPALSEIKGVAEDIIIDNSPSLDLSESPMCLDTSVDVSAADAESAGREIISTVPEYQEEIYAYLREAELQNRPKPGYMKKQPDVTNTMRTVLVDWLVEVAEEYKLHRETLCLSVNYIDRFLSQMSVLRTKLQLVGAASMFLAGKYEEIYPPDVGEFVYITDDTYTKKQVLRMEHLILKVLSFNIAIPTVNCFCETFLKHNKAEDKTDSLAYYLMELSMLETDPYLKYLPSTIAAASVCLANHTMGHPSWPQHMVKVTGYEIKDFENCLRDLYATMCRAPASPQQAIREKYRQSKYHEVSNVVPPSTLPMVNLQ